MAFVATLDRIDKVKNVEDEMMNYELCKIQSSYGKKRLG